MMVRLVAAWQALTRRLDVRFLWPSCRDEAARRGGSVDLARAAFAMHAYNDPAWLALGPDEIYRRIEGLK
jgi:hypothetical protein